MRKELARVPTGKHSHSYSATNVTTAAWVEVVPSLVAAASAIQIYDSSGRVLRVSLGPAGQEEGTNPLTGKPYEFPMYVTPGGNYLLVPAELTRGARVSLRAVDVNATTGLFILNLFG